MSYVVDGDTFELIDGRRVRVLGIDSCKIETYGGKLARKEAESRLPAGARIVLTQEPGVDKDSNGRLLRYVQDGGADFGLKMVQYDHTGIYNPENNAASQAYTDQLYANDTKLAANPPAGRMCEDPTPPPPPPPAPVQEEEEDDDRRRAPALKPEPASNCHDSYSPCIPDGPDLDCGDLSHSVSVRGPDEYRLDGDDDGVGCE